MNAFTLVIIMMAYPEYKAGGIATSVVVPGFTTEQSCMNAARKITLPKPATREVQQVNTVACVAASI